MPLSSSRRLRSTRKSGEAARAFITLISVCPPARARAPSCSERRRTASWTPAGRAYSTSRKSMRYLYTSARSCHDRTSGKRGPDADRLRVGQSCSARYKAAYERYGLTCTNRHLRKRTTPNPPEPPPSHRRRHHRLRCRRGPAITTDVRSDGRAVTGLSTGQISQGCTPPSHTSGGLTNESVSVLTDGTFSIDFDYQGRSATARPTTGTST